MPRWAHATSHPQRRYRSASSWYARYGECAIAVSLYVLNRQQLRVHEASVADHTVYEEVIVAGIIGTRAARRGGFPGRERIGLVVLGVGQQAADSRFAGQLPDLFSRLGLHWAAEGIPNRVSEHAF